MTFEKPVNYNSVAFMKAEARPEFTFGASFEATIRDIKPAASLGGEGSKPVAIFERNGKDVWCSLPSREFALGQEIVITPVTNHDHNSGGFITTWDIARKPAQTELLEEADLIERHKQFLRG